MNLMDKLSHTASKINLTQAFSIGVAIFNINFELCQRIRVITSLRSGDFYTDVIKLIPLVHAYG